MNNLNTSRTISSLTVKPSGGAQFELGMVSDSFIPLSYRWSEQGRISVAAVELIQYMFEICNHRDPRITGLGELTEGLGVSRSTMLTRCSELIEAGLMTKTLRAAYKTRSVTVYTLIEPKVVPAKQNGEALNQPSERQLALLDIEPDDQCTSITPYSDDRFISDSRKLTVKGEALSIFALAAALPSGKSGRFTEHTYDVPVRIGNETMRVEVRPTQGTKVASVLDMRVLVAIITLVHRRISGGNTAKNPFVFLFDDICDLLRGAGMENFGGSFKTYVLNSITRWESTGFSVVSASQGILDKYRGRLELKKAFRLINSYSVLSYVGSKGKIPEKIALSLDEDLLARINDPAVKYLLSMHAECLREHSPLALRFNIWCRRAIQHNHVPRIWPGEWLHREIEPLRPPKKFRADMKELFNDTNRKRANGAHSHIAGYNFRPVPGRWAYEIWADQNDYLVGRESQYALHNRNNNGPAFGDDIQASLPLMRDAR